MGGDVLGWCGDGWRCLKMGGDGWRCLRMCGDVEMFKDVW